MQSPLVALMEIAGGAADLVKRAMGNGTPKAGFDEQFQKVLAEAPGVERNLKGKTTEGKGGIHEDMKAVFEDPRAEQVLQYLAALNSLGLNMEDAKALLSGEGEISDGGLKAILAAMGIKGADCAQLMTDPELVAGLKARIGQTVSAGFQEGLNPLLQSTGEGISDEMLAALMNSSGLADDDITQLMADAAKVAELKTLIAHAASTEADGLSQGTAGETADQELKALLAAMGMQDPDIERFLADQEKVSSLKIKLAEISSSGINSRVGGALPDIDKMMGQIDTLNAMIAQFAASKGFPAGITKGIDPLVFKTVTAEIPQVSSAIKESVAGYLTSNGMGAYLPEASHSVASTAGASDAPAMTQVLEAVDTLEKTFNIPKKTVQDLIFSSTPEVRSAAVDEAASRVNEFLTANAGKDLTKQVEGALSLLKGTLSKEEFAKMENVLKAFNQDPALIGQGVTIDRHGMQSIARALGADPGLARNSYTQQVMDQISQALPAGIKAGEGSMILKLNPPMLGRVDVDIRMQDGKILASFKADQSVTREILQQNMHLLKDALSDQGIKAAQFVVSADSFNSREHREAYAAWAGYEQGKGGSSRQGNGTGTGSSRKDQDEYGHTYEPLNRYAGNGRLDIIA